MKRSDLKLEIRNLAHKYGRQDGGLSTIGKRKVSLILNEILKTIESLEEQVTILDQRTTKRPRGRPRKQVAEAEYE